MPRLWLFTRMSLTGPSRLMLPLEDMCDALSLGGDVRYAVLLALG